MRLIALILFFGIVYNEQQLDFDLGNIRFKGLKFSTTKEAIVKVLGQGRRVETSYECGFFSNDQEGGPFYQLVYTDFNYIGSDREKLFYLEHVSFDSTGTTKLMYLEKELSGKTTSVEFVKMFGDEFKQDSVKPGSENSIFLPSKGSDDGALFWFKNGRLFKFQYWTPC